MKTFQDFSPHNGLYGNQTVQGPKDSFSANSNGRLAQMVCSVMHVHDCPVRTHSSK